MNNKLYFIDCMEFMKDKPDNFYDLAIPDIQYGINQGGKGNNSRSKLAVAKNYKDYDDSKTMPIEYHQELRRVSKNQIIWGANHFISKMPFDSSCWIVWDKMNGKTDFADCELAWTSFKTAVRIFKFQWQGMIQGYSGNKSKNEIRIHPNQKPVALYKWLLKNYAAPGFKLLDTHSGSGSFRVAAHDMGFDIDSCENDEHYYIENNIRFNRHILQQDLFTGKDLQRLIF